MRRGGAREAPALHRRRSGAAARFRRQDAGAGAHAAVAVDDAERHVVTVRPFVVVDAGPVEEAAQRQAGGERRAGDLVPVALTATVTEVGTLELWCKARDGAGRWKLEYAVRER